MAIGFFHAGIRSGLLLWCCIGPGFAQDPPTFRSGVSNVRIDAQVTTEEAFVRGLGPPDFEVLDEGQPQSLLYGALDTEPIDILLLLDVSGSMRDQVTSMASVATQSLQYLHKDDRVGIMVFATTAKLKTELTANLEQIPEELKEAARDDSVGALTATNSAILEAVKYLDSASTRARRAILILTDNLGENYRLKDEPVIDALLRANVVLESIVIGKNTRVPPPGTQASKNPEITYPNVFWIAAETGGEAVRVEAATRAFPRFMESIRTRYSLQYHAPSSKRGEFRRVEVRLSPAAKLRFPNAVVRARRGYYVRD